MAVRKPRHAGRTDHEARNLVSAMNGTLVRVLREETARSARAERSFLFTGPSASVLSNPGSLRPVFTA